MATTRLSPGNIAQAAFEETNDSIRVTVVGDGSPTSPGIVSLSDGTALITSTVVGSDRALDVNIVNGIELTISHIDDSIRLGDGTNLVTTTNQGGKQGLDVNLINPNINTTITPAPAGPTSILYGTVSNIAVAGTATVITFTIPASGQYYLQKIYVSGTQNSTYSVYSDINILIKTRMAHTQFTQVLDLSTGSAFGLQASAGTVIKIEVENNGTSLGTFDGSLQFMVV